MIKCLQQNYCLGREKNSNRYSTFAVESTTHVTLRVCVPIRFCEMMVRRVEEVNSFAQGKTKTLSDLYGFKWLPSDALL